MRSRHDNCEACSTISAAAAPRQALHLLWLPAPRRSDAASESEREWALDLVLECKPRRPDSSAAVLRLCCGVAASVVAGWTLRSTTLLALGSKNYDFVTTSQLLRATMKAGEKSWLGMAALLNYIKPQAEISNVCTQVHKQCLTLRGPLKLYLAITAYL